MYMCTCLHIYDACMSEYAYVYIPISKCICTCVLAHAYVDTYTFIHMYMLTPPPKIHLLVVRAVTESRKTRSTAMLKNPTIMKPNLTKRCHAENIPNIPKSLHLLLQKGAPCLIVFRSSGFFGALESLVRLVPQNNVVLKKIKKSEAEPHQKL